jgi:hypothetical protein
MTPEQIQEQYKLASHWFQTILLRLDEAIIPLSILSKNEIEKSWDTRYLELLSAYNKYFSVTPTETDLLDAIRFIAKVAMGNHRAALRLKNIDAVQAVKLIPTPSFQSLKTERMVFQGFMPS